MRCAGSYLCAIFGFGPSSCLGCLTGILLECLSGDMTYGMNGTIFANHSPALGGVPGKIETVPSELYCWKLLVSCWWTQTVLVHVQVTVEGDSRDIWW